MRMPLAWLVAAVVAILLALSLTVLLPGSDETTGDTQPGPLPQSPPPAPEY
jgi:hypothetical protein